jgi:hypothetical protein
MTGMSNRRMPFWARRRTELGGVARGPTAKTAGVSEREPARMRLELLRHQRYGDTAILPKLPLADGLFV